MVWLTNNKINFRLRIFSGNLNFRHWHIINPVADPEGVRGSLESHPHPLKMQ